MLRNWKHGIHRTALFTVIFALCLLVFAPATIVLPACAAEVNQLQMDQNVVPFGKDFTMRYYGSYTGSRISIYEKNDEQFENPLYEWETEDTNGFLNVAFQDYPLIPGEYSIIYYRSSSVVAGRGDLIVTDDSLYSNRQNYTAGTDGFIYYDPSILGENAWIGIYKKGADPEEEYSKVWAYLSDEESCIWTGSLTGNSNRFIQLSPGNYQIYLFADDTDYIPEESFDFTIQQQVETSAAYRRSSDAHNGTVEGSIVINSGKKKLEDYYWLYWGDEQGILDDYTPIAILDTEESNTVWFRTNEEAPAEATHIYMYPGTAHVKKSSAVPFVLELPSGISSGDSPVLASFTVLSDVHVTQSASNVFNRNFVNALKQVSKYMPDSDALILSGDITNNGKTPEYEKLMDAISNYQESLPSVYFAIGNHDMMLNRDDPERQIDYFLEYTQMPGNYYQFDMDGYSFFVIGSDGQPDSVAIGSDVSWMSQEQLDWLAEGLAEEAARAPEQPIFVISHQPLLNTVPESHYETIQQNDELMAILEQYPQVIFISGHTHYALDVETDVNSGYGEGISTVHAGCVSRLWSREEGNYTGSQGIYVEICEDFVRINGFDFKEGSWMGGARYVLYE